MSRIVKHTQTGPSEVNTKSGDSVWICRCGLTQDEKGQCDGSHNKTTNEDPNTTYSYESEERNIIKS